MQIVFSSLENVNITSNFFYRLDLEKVLEKYYLSIFSSSVVEQLAVN